MNTGLRLASCIALALAAEAHAATWTLEPMAVMRAGYEDNVRLTAARPLASASRSLLLDAPLVMQSDVWRLALTPEAELVRYDDQSLLNRNDYRAVTSLAFNGERLSVTGSTRYVDDTTLTSELGLTSFAEAVKPHTSKTQQLGSAWRMSERWQTTLDASYAAHSYADAEATPLRNYDYAFGAWRTSYEYTERFSFDASIAHGELLRAGRDGDATTDSIRAGLQFQMADRWQLGASAGPLRIANDRFREDGLGYEAHVTRRSPTATTELRWARDATPTGIGTLSKREELELNAQIVASPRLQTTLSAQRTQVEQTAAGYVEGARWLRYSVAACAAQWSMTPTLAISAALSWTKQESRVATTRVPADGYRAQLGVVWRSARRGR